MAEDSKAYKFGSMVGKVLANIVMIVIIIVAAGLVAKPAVSLFMYGYQLVSF
jgi:hypothetical protein